ncbi:hypothetical protein MLD38_026680 [Melastoma candidum]|uniref:Uncharacterized protein n=1 Tax=Melastoma candidum TaxID=119954 RepID=A0ACB9P2A2_9MYRT|nr:hypothetical protein MLD38_026680 [Melastoma candidum]
MTTHLYNFAQGGGPDPTIDPSFLPELESKCPRNGDVNARITIDHGSEDTFDDQILWNIGGGLAVLQSDAKLNNDPDPRSIHHSYFGTLSPFFGPSFEADFVQSMVKIGVKTGTDGEIRKVLQFIQLEKRIGPQQFDGNKTNRG